MKKLLKRIFISMIALVLLAAIGLGIFLVVRKRPAGDDVIDVLMVGNSFSYYYTDELWGIANAAGIKMNVCNIYYSGCSLEKHWKLWQDNEYVYRLRVYNEDGRRVWQHFNMELCLFWENWDVITLQESSKWIRKGGLESARTHAEPYMGNLVQALQERFPETPLYYHQLWAYQVGYNRSNFSISNTQEQTAYYEAIRNLSTELCDKYDLPRIPCGDAWQIARQDPLIGDTLCGRKGTMHGDYYHDGDIGGGQYLNACVWFEMITGQSCIGNTYRPSYDLSEEKILALQRAAHQAVEDMKNQTP